MNKHEKARKKLVIVTNYLTKLFEDCPEEIGDLEDYINSCEATENELSTCKIERSLNEKMYEELKRDVKRYFYLLSIYFNKATNDEVKEYAQLKDKLSKVGDSNE